MFVTGNPQTGEKNEIFKIAEKFKKLVQVNLFVKLFFFDKLIDISVLILRAGQLGALIEYTSRLEGNKLVSNGTNLFRTINTYCNK